MPFQDSDSCLGDRCVDWRECLGVEFKQPALHEIGSQLAVSAKAQDDQVSGQSGGGGSDDAGDIGQGAAKASIAWAGNCVATNVDNGYLLSPTPPSGSLDLCAETTTTEAGIEKDEISVECLGQGWQGRSCGGNRSGLAGDDVDVLDRLVEAFEVGGGSWSGQGIDQEPVPSPGGDHGSLLVILGSNETGGDGVTTASSGHKKRLHGTRSYGFNGGIVH
jgi:hypothetical protein